MELTKEEPVNIYEELQKQKEAIKNIKDRIRILEEQVALLLDKLAKE